MPEEKNHLERLFDVLKEQADQRREARKQASPYHTDVTKLVNDGKALDITAPTNGVVIEIAQTHVGQVLWVNVDGFCVLRVCRSPHIEVQDTRTSKE